MLLQKSSIIITGFALLVTGLVFFTLASIFSTSVVLRDGGLATEATVSLNGTVASVDVTGISPNNPGIVAAVTDSGETFVILVPTSETATCQALTNIADVTMVSAGDMITVVGERDQAGNIVPCTNANHSFSVFGQGGEREYGYEFTYRKGPLGYLTLVDDESTHPDFVVGTQLFDRAEYEIFMNARDAREGPPAMHVRVYRNSDRQSAAVWAMEQSTETNSHLAMGEMSEAVVGGANAVRFVADGLYPTATYVVAHGDYIYVLMGSYLTVDSALYRDFETLVASLTFVPTGAENRGAKIDPRVACESALMYMTFPNGEAADAFVAACVAGEHPEVIERYINDMRLPGAQI